MIYYKNPNGDVFSFETEAERDQYGAPDLVRMTQEEVDAHLNPVPTYSQALASLNAAYQVKVDGFNRQFALAALADGLSEQSKKVSIRAEYEIAKTQHAANIAQLKIQYGLGV